MRHMAITLLALLCASRADLDAAEPGDIRWTHQSVEDELRTFEPVLKKLGLNAPMKRARDLAAREQDWNCTEVQRRWQSRIDYWRRVLLDEESWGDVLDLTHSQLQALKDPFEVGGATAQEAWAKHIRNRPGVPGDVSSVPFQKLLFEAYSWIQFRDDDTFMFERAEELIQGRIRMLDLEPVQVDPDADYDWLASHPRDRLFHVMHQNQWHSMCLGLAHLHRPDDKWARQWVRMTIAHIDQCPRLPNGHTDFATLSQRHNNTSWSHYGYVAGRLRYLVLNYLVMKDSPVLSPRIHSVVLRMIRSHAQHLDALGDAAYLGNYCSSTGKALFLTATLLPEICVSDRYVERMFQRLQQALGKELLSDACHVHRSFSYHLTFVQRPLSMILVAKHTGRTNDLPPDFLTKVEDATEAFALMSTPIRSTPGINDDWTVAESNADLLQLSADAFDRDDWRYLATDGRSGRAPKERSCLLPQAQLFSMRSDWSPTARYLFFNVSPDGGHHHPDTLSVQIWSGGRHLLIDPGVGHYYTGERAIAKRSWWHNCPTLGQQQLPNNSQPKVLHWETSPDFDYAVGQISIGSAKIRRHVFFVERRYWVLWDEFLDLPQTGELWENFHFAVNRSEIEIHDDGRFVRTKLPTGTNLALFTRQMNWTHRLEDASKWLTYGGKPIPTALLHFQTQPQIASKGFAALWVSFADENDLRQTSMGHIERHPDGRVTLHVTRLGERKTVTTRQFGN